jgi:amino acid permease
MNKEATLLYVGTTIGAGIFALPFLIGKLGLFLGIMAMIFCQILLTGLGVCIVELVDLVKARDFRELIRKLNPTLETPFIISILIFSFIAISAYISGTEVSFKNIFNINLLGMFFCYLIVVFTLLSGFKILYLDDLMTIFMIVLMVLVSLILLPKFKFYFSSDLNYLFPVFSTSIFALSGLIVIPEMYFITKSKIETIKSLIAGQIIVLILYLIFVISCVGGLKKLTSPITTAFYEIRILGITVDIIAILAYVTSAIGISLVIRDILLSYGLSEILIASFSIISLVLVFFASFGKLVELAGALGLCFQNIILSELYIQFGRNNILKLFAGICIAVFLIIGLSVI